MANKQRPLLTALLACVMLLTVVLAACSGKNEGNSSPSPSPSPSASATPTPEPTPEPTPTPEAAELSVYGNADDATFETFGTKMINAKYPDYKVTYHCSCVLNVPDLKEKSGIMPDIHFDLGYEGLQTLKGFSAEQDLTELINSGIVDLNRFDPATIQSIKNWSGGDKIYGLPYNSNPIVVYYNKDVFDKFGVEYPKDGMSWDDLYALAQKVTGNKDGVDYRGVSMFYNFMLDKNEFSLPILDPATGKAAVNNDGWKRIFENLGRFYQIKGNTVGFERGNSGLELNKFYEAKNIAMVVSLLSSYNRPGFETLNWDMVSAPTHPDNNGTGFQIHPSYIYVSNTAANKEAALKAVDAILSDEAQLEASKLGRVTPLTNPDVRAAFGSGVERLQGKNAGAVFVNKVAPSPAVFVAGALNPTTILAAEFDAYILGEKDVAKALADAETEINKAVEAALAAQ